MQPRGSRTCRHSGLEGRPGGGYGLCPHPASGRSAQSVRLHGSSLRSCSSRVRAPIRRRCYGALLPRSTGASLLLRNPGWMPSNKRLYLTRARVSAIQLRTCTSTPSTEGIKPCTPRALADIIRRPHAPPHTLPLPPLGVSSCGVPWVHSLPGHSAPALWPAAMP